MQQTKKELLGSTLYHRALEAQHEANTSRWYATYLREKAKREGKPVPHCCGAAGFGYESTDICPACEDREKKSDV